RVLPTRTVVEVHCLIRIVHRTTRVTRRDPPTTVEPRMPTSPSALLDPPLRRIPQRPNPTTTGIPAVRGQAAGAVQVGQRARVLPLKPPAGRPLHHELIRVDDDRRLVLRARARPATASEPLG